MEWERDVQIIQGSPQVAELAAVVRVFEKFSELINIVTDSAYIAGVTARAENVLLKKMTSKMNKRIFNMLSKLIQLVSHQEQPYCEMHIWSHTDLPGPFAEGNRRADTLAMPARSLLPCQTSFSRPS